MDVILTKIATKCSRQNRRSKHFFFCDVDQNPDEDSRPCLPAPVPTEGGADRHPSPGGREGPYVKEINAFVLVSLSGMVETPRFQAKFFLR
jgi:hypothetical protein